MITLLWAATGSSLPPVNVTAPPQALHGHVPKITKKLSPLGRLDDNYHMEVAIGLPLRNREQLTNLLADIYNPASPNFRHFLKADEFTAAFGPTEADYQSVIDFAHAHHLTVAHTHPNRTLVHITGSVRDIEKAFNVHLQKFKHPNENRNFFAPDVEPSVDLATPLLAISGLNSYKHPQPLIRPAVRPAVRPLGGGSGGGGGGGGGAGGSGPDGSYFGYDFLDAYLPNTELTGEGQSVGLFELYGYSAQDIDDYVSETGLPGVPLVNVLVDGFDGSDSDPDYLPYAEEVTVDIEMAISMAPNLASVIIYEGPAPNYLPPVATNAVQWEYTTAQINDVLNRMATDNAAKQLSSSYQMDVNLSTMQIFQQFAAQGQSFFQASGDFGAFPAAVDEPSDNPCITIVGGTTLSTTGGDWASEVVWLTPAYTDPLFGFVPLQGTGGGISTAYPIPWWQQGISMTANQGSTTMRNLPDVAMISDNIDVVFGNDAIGLGFDFSVSGTSLAAPLWAAFTALVNEQASLNNQPPVGFLNPALYAIGKSTNYQTCFHDITSGVNTNNASPTKYVATVGYDLCTGWGTINSNLIAALLAPPVETLRVTSPLGFTSQGRSGGPFTVTGQTYTLTNTGVAPLTWSLANGANWLNVSSTGGTLNPGGPSATVTVSLNTNASSFLIQHASGNVAFNNLTAGTTQNRQFDLYVGNGGFENGDLTNWTQVGDTNLSFALAGDDVEVAGTNALDGAPDTLFVHSGIWGAYLGQWPSNGSLSQSVPTVAGKKLLVSFWLTSVADDQGHTSPNGFAAKWNGTNLFTGTNLPVRGWTNLQYIVSSGGTNGTLQFQYNDTPGAFGLDDVTIQAIPAPVLGPPQVSGGNINLSWSTFAGLSYQIQSTTNLAPTGWTNVGSAILATNTVINAPVPIGSSSRQFYRVAILP